MPLIISHRAQGLQWFDHIQQKMVTNIKDNDQQAINYFCTTPGTHNVNYVEVDVRVRDGKLWVGHDRPEYQFPYVEWYQCPNLIVHCKTLEAVKWIQQRTTQPSFDYFFHDNDEATFTRKGRLWVHPRVVYNIPQGILMPNYDIPKKSFVVVNFHPNGLCCFPQDECDRLRDWLKTVGGVCTDYPKQMDEWLNADE